MDFLFSKFVDVDGYFKSIFLKIGLTLKDLHNTTCMIQLVWLYKIVSLYKFDVQIFVW